MGAASACERISEELFTILGTGQQVEPFSGRYPGFDLAAAYEVVARVRDRRVGRGEMPIGRKIGFTNRSIWEDSGISAPIWNYVFDRTVDASNGGQRYVDLRGMPEPRIEPEVVLHLDSAPVVGMSAKELAACIDWAAPGFEVVYSVFPGWNFTAADAAAAFGVHGALFIGERRNLDPDGTLSAPDLADFSVTLKEGNGARSDGHARNVLGGPMEALKFLVEELARYPICEPLKAGEVVTTGTLTAAMPVEPGQAWRASFRGIDFAPLCLRTA